MKRKFFLSVVGIMLCGVVFGADVPSDIAQKEQEQIREVFYRKYTPYLKKYIKVFMAHSSCRYDFIEDTKLNDLADRVIGQAVSDFDKALHGSAFPLLRERSDARAYLANFAAFSMIDAQSQLITEGHVNRYSRPVQCKKHRLAIKSGYDELPKLAAKILSEK